MTQQEIQFIQSLIGSGNTKDALLELSKYASVKSDSQFNNQCIMLTSQFNKLEHKNIVGIIPNDQYNEEINKINYSILQIIKNDLFNDEINNIEGVYPVNVNLSEGTNKYNFTLLNILLTITILLIIRYKLWFDLEYDFNKNELISLLGLGTLYGVSLQMLPENLKAQLKNKTKYVLSNRYSFISLIISLIIIVSSSLLITATKIEWTGPDSIYLKINNQHRTIIDKNVKKTNFHCYWHPTHIFKSNTYKYDLLEKYVISNPLSIDYFKIPATLTLIKDNRYETLEELLQLSMFQYREKFYLNEAYKKIEQLTSLEADNKLLAIRFEKIHSFLKYIFVDADISENKVLILESLKNEFPNDCWIPILESLLEYSKENYSKAIDQISHLDTIGCTQPHLSTIKFITGIYYLKASKQAKSLEEIEKSKHFSHLADSLFTNCIANLGTLKESYYKEIAIPSCFVFKAINQFYQSNYDSAKIFHVYAAKTGHNSIRARGYNGAGYINLMEGNFEIAEENFESALQMDPNFSLAKSNYGYLLLASDKHAAAKKIFLENLNDPLLKAEYYRDIILAKAALINLYSSSFTNPDSVFYYYNSLCADLPLKSYNQISNDYLKLAFINYSLAMYIYSDKKYYGLEIFGVVSLSKAFESLNEYYKTTKATDKRSGKLREDIIECMNKYKPLVNPKWYKVCDKSNYFSPIKIYIDIVT